MVRERCHLYRPVGNVERAEVRIGEFVFKHQAPMPVEPNIHASERLDPRAVQLIVLVKCAADIRLDMRDRGAESNARVRLQMAEEIFAAYKSTVLGALSDVENALVSYDREQVRRASLADAVDANRRAVDLANTLYVQGETDSLNLLTAQRLLNSSEDALEQSDRTIRQNLIALYKALGGGW